MGRWFICVQTKSTKSRSQSRGRFRGEVWSIEIMTEWTREAKLTYRQIAQEMTDRDEGKGEILAKLKSYKQVREAMLKWHNYTNRTWRGQSDVPAKVIVEHARAFFKKFDK